MIIYINIILRYVYFKKNIILLFIKIKFYIFFKYLLHMCYVGYINMHNIMLLKVEFWSFNLSLLTILICTPSSKIHIDY